MRRESHITSDGYAIWRLQACGRPTTMIVSKHTGSSSPPRTGDCGQSSHAKEEQPVAPIAGSGAHNDTKEGHQLIAHWRNVLRMRGLPFSRWKAKNRFQMRFNGVISCVWLVPF